MAQPQGSGEEGEGKETAPKKSVSLPNKRTETFVSLSSFSLYTHTLHTAGFLSPSSYFTLLSLSLKSSEKRPVFQSINAIKGMVYWVDFSLEIPHKASSLFFLFSSPHSNSKVHSLPPPETVCVISEIDFQILSLSPPSPPLPTQRRTYSASDGWHNN